MKIKLLLIVLGLVVSSCGTGEFTDGVYDVTFLEAQNTCGTDNPDVHPQKWKMWKTGEELSVLDISRSGNIPMKGSKEGESYVFESAWDEVYPLCTVRLEHGIYLELGTEEFSGSEELAMGVIFGDCGGEYSSCFYEWKLEGVLVKASEN